MIVFLFWFNARFLLCHQQKVSIEQACTTQESRRAKLST